jgi:hypothetical protein
MSFLLKPISDYALLRIEEEILQAILIFILEKMVLCAKISWRIPYTTLKTICTTE